MKALKTMLFNPYTGTPRHPMDISSDPEGILILDPDLPVLAARTSSSPATEPDERSGREASYTATKLAELILSDCGHSTAISTALRDRVALRIDKYTDALAEARALAAPTAPAPTEPVVQDAKRWQFISDRYSVSFMNGKFISLNSVVSEEWRQSLNASVNRMMAGDWSDADAAEEKSAEPEKAIQQADSHPDTLRLDAIEQRRIALIPEYEGPWDAQLYGDREVPWVVGTSSTVREAIDEAIRIAKTTKERP